MFAAFLMSATPEPIHDYPPFAIALPPKAKKDLNAYKRVAEAALIRKAIAGDQIAYAV